jgi:integrase
VLPSGHVQFGGVSDLVREWALRDLDGARSLFITGGNRAFGALAAGRGSKKTCRAKPLLLLAEGAVLVLLLEDHIALRAGALTFHDLRGTAVTRLSEAECTPQEIATITGHSLRDVGAIMDRYSARTDKLAVAAIAKLERGRG